MNFMYDDLKSAGEINQYVQGNEHNITVVFGDGSEKDKDEYATYM